MDGMGFFKAAVMGVVEGLTEFLPISSTGHLILAGNALSIAGEKAKLFEVFIQLGAILAVVWLYREKIFSMLRKFTADAATRRFGIGVFIAFLPAAFVGLATHNYIKTYLFSPLTVALALVVGGVIILLIERLKHSNRVSEMEDITYTVALAVGIAQILALFPGISRSGATIMGGLVAGMSRKASTEFSFFLAIPTMFAATVFDLTKGMGGLTWPDYQVLAVGFIAAFISALWVVRWLIRFVSSNDFKAFAWYRIGFGGILLWYFLSQVK